MFLQEIQRAIQFYWRALKLIEKKQLWRILTVPAVLNLLAACGVALLAWKTSGYAASKVMGHFRIVTEDAIVSGFVENVLVLTIRGTVLFLYLKLFRYTMLILFAPLYVWASERAQSAITGLYVEYGSARYMGSVGRAMRIASVHFLYEVGLTIAVLVVTLLVTWLLPLAPFLLLALESYYFGYSMMEYRNMHAGISSKESGDVIRSHLGLTLGNGLFFNILLIVPLLGVMFAPQLALVSAGMSLHCAEKRKSILCQSNPSTLIMAKS
jgi:CysZ protein